MKKLELVTVHFKDFAGNFIFNLNCTMRKKNISNNKRTIPSRSKFTENKLKARVKQEHFLANMELLPKNLRVTKPLHFLLIDLGVLIGF